MLSAILFDLDGTLANTDPLHFLTWKEILAHFDLFIDQEFYNRRISGRLNEVIIKDILPQLSDTEGIKLAEEKEAQFRQLAQGLQPMNGLIHLLEWAQSRQIKQAVVTNAPRKNAEFMLEVLGLQQRLPTVILAEEAPKGKPDPAPYLLALNRLGVSAAEAVAFEDSPSGIRAATAAGIFTIGVNSTHDSNHLLESGAKWIIEDFNASQLWQWLNQ
uniref:HAD-superfamily hydrolase, subfamily IA, variant 3 n=2 Tax=Gloeothece TaxID=28070 RepID=E0UG36_GLOV7|nr:HAD-superfamily hydrolase, subfamily IA, variant 3 [Gloeothece verrucosa PCC 7822]